MSLWHCLFCFDGLPFLLIAWFGMWVFRPLVTFIHELGHAMPALILTKKQVSLRVGKAGGRAGNLGRRLEIVISCKNGQEGCTQYSLEKTKVFSRLIILSGGPLITSLNSFFSGYLLFNKQPWHLWIELLLVIWFCANTLALLRSVIPMRLRPTETFPEGPKSDGLQILCLLRGKKDDCEVT